MDIPVNYVAVLVAALVAFGVGWLWHSPFLFGKMYMRLGGMPMPATITPEMKKSMKRGMIFGLITALIMAYVLSILSFVFGTHDTVSALMLGFWIWLGFIVTSLANDVLWWKKPANLYVFNIVYLFVSIELMTLIVGLWI